ncbi:MAG: alpha/beta hydrolase [Lachnospiraceae bacterium]|nr:alpha/beta hydrolase [Lachnospiraceae bacterium]
MSNKVSLKGRTARHMVRLYNHFPGIGKKAQTGELRKVLTEKENDWVVPEGLKLNVIELDNCTMELLTSPESQEAVANEDYVEIEATSGILLHIHGGGYYNTLHNGYRDMAALYHNLSDGLDVLSLDYRVAPDNPYPAAFEDAISAYKWILDNDYDENEIYIAGDSAGGGLTLALSLYLRDHNMPLPKKIITMSAWTDLTKSGDSYDKNFWKDPVFGGSKKSLVYMEGYYKDNDPSIPYISPINGDYKGFPPMLMQVGELEMLLNDTTDLANKAKEAGVDVTVHIYPGMFHDFQMGLYYYPESEAAWEEIKTFLNS